MIGTGQQCIFDVVNGQLVNVTTFSCPEGLFDCAWSECNPNHVVSACGNASVRLWDLSGQTPPRIFAEHTAEVYSVDWNLVSKDTFLSGSWDGTVKVCLPSTDVLVCIL